MIKPFSQFCESKSTLYALVVRGIVVARGSKRILLRRAREYGGRTDPRDPNGVFIALTPKGVGERWDAK